MDKRYVQLKLWDDDVYFGFNDNSIFQVVVDKSKLDQKILFSSDDNDLKRAQMLLDKFLNYQENVFLLTDFDIKGTELQCAVWSYLLTLKFNQTITYQELAKAIGREKAVRAVASAVAKNQILFFIPCHRVIAKNGSIKYSGGPKLKEKLLSLGL